jgi:hypothetical protein
MKEVLHFLITLLLFGVVYWKALDLIETQKWRRALTGTIVIGSLWYAMVDVTVVWEISGPWVLVVSTVFTGMFVSAFAINAVRVTEDDTIIHNDDAVGISEFTLIFLMILFVGVIDYGPARYATLFQTLTLFCNGLVAGSLLTRVGWIVADASNIVNSTRSS